MNKEGSPNRSENNEIFRSDIEEIKNTARTEYGDEIADKLNIEIYEQGEGISFVFRLEDKEVIYGTSTKDDVVFDGKIFLGQFMEMVNSAEIEGAEN